MKVLSNDIILQIRRLLHRDHEPIVTKKTSILLKNAGIGVFTTTTVLKGEALCLYPGVYCQGLPLSMVDSVVNESYGEEIEFLGHNTTPSGIPMGKNAYILNIQTAMGGYIDGMALQMIKGRPVSIWEYGFTHTEYHSQLKTPLDSNPSCCGHLINHSIRRQNVQILPFLWSDVVEPIHDNRKYVHKQKPTYTKKQLSSLPNIMRQDGAPRYMFNGDVTHYASIEDTTSRITNVHGAVICATKHIGPDQELLFDYGLNAPLPQWAESWYDNEE